ncbi:MAG TPA: hypothetical protein VF543_22560 [Pyrinomonadaceae bacterium]
MTGPTTHRVKEEDRKRITCQTCFVAPADICEHVQWDVGVGAGISFFYHCDPCFEQLLERRSERAAKSGCSKTGLSPAICGHCRWPELYKEAEVIAREVGEKCNRRGQAVKSEMPYKAGFILEMTIQILKRSV